jgi:two-component system, OmpR family, phosphate regulon sensor histidine kinase PhoR
MAIVRSRLFLKIMSAYVLLLMALMSAVLLAIAYRIHENYIQCELGRLQTAAHLLAGNLPDPSSPAVLGRWTEKNGKRTGFRVTFINSQGTVLADNQGSPERMDNHSNRPEVRDALRLGEGHSIRFSRTIKKNELYFALKVRDGSVSPAVLRLALPLQEVSEASRAAQKDLVGISLLFFFLAVGLGYALTRSLTNRIETIRRFADNVTMGNLDARIRDETSDELGSLANSLNATASRLQQIIDELKSEKKTMTAILEGMQAGVLATDQEGRVTLTNPALDRILGIEGGSSIGKRVIEVVRNAELKGIFDNVHMENREVIASIEITLNTTRSFEVVAVPLIDPIQKHGGVVAVLHEITRQKELEKIRRDFVANVSHELRTPLTAIRGFAETLLDGALDDRSNNRRFIEVIKSHAVRLSDLTKDLLVLASLESESFRLNIEDIDLPSLIQDAVESMKPLAAAKQQDISCQLSRDLPGVRGDKEKLVQVLVNLLDNAIKFTPDRGMISIQAGFEPGTAGIVIHVRDNGSGIAYSEIPRIFERFYRVDRARSREQGGTGLGLSIVKHIIEAHKGRIEVKSTLGQGSDFFFSLPLA